MDAGEGDEQTHTGGIQRDTPGVGRPIHHLVQEDGGDNFAGCHVDDRHGIGIDPAAIELGGRQVKSAECVDDVSGVAVAAEGDAAGVGGAERQADWGFGLQCLEIDHRHLGGRVRGDGGGVRDEVCLLYTSPSPRDRTRSRMPSSA